MGTVGGQLQHDVWLGRAQLGELARFEAKGGAGRWSRL
jgi:hypothetical protein